MTWPLAILIYGSASFAMTIIWSAFFAARAMLEHQFVSEQPCSEHEGGNAPDDSGHGLGVGAGDVFHGKDQ